MPYRYTGRGTITNDVETYEDLTADRGLSFIKHFRVPRLRHPTARERSNFTRIRHTWKLGDRYWKLSAEHYNNSKYWWVIAWYNQKPVENMLTIGDTIIIPKPLQSVLEYVKYY
jgi:hypothetical protein